MPVTRPPHINHLILISAVAFSGAAMAEGPGMGKPCGMKAYMDADGDGVVTRKEFMEGHEKMFDRIDANGDGVIDADERREHHKHKKGRMGKEGCPRGMNKGQGKGQES